MTCTSLGRQEERIGSLPIQGEAQVGTLGRRSLHPKSRTVVTGNRTGASESCMKMMWWLVFAGKAARFIKVF